MLSSGEMLGRQVTKVCKSDDRCAGRSERSACTDTPTKHSECTWQEGAWCLTSNHPGRFARSMASIPWHLRPACSTDVGILGRLNAYSHHKMAPWNLRQPVVLLESRQPNSFGKLLPSCPATGDAQKLGREGEQKPKPPALWLPAGSGAA